MKAQVASPQQPQTPPKSGYRADIDGVRAIAVLAVVAFHLRAPFAESGFTGVDIFFVLSGFLITGNLASESERTGGIDLVRFWARRIRRLLPASTVTILVTVAAALLLLPATAWNEVIRTAVASTLYFANFQFGADSANYFAADVENNPLLHFWSLAVEEQFYLVWPVVVWGAAKWWRRARGSVDMMLAGPIAALTIGSFILSLWLTSLATPWSYYASPARAWEFGVGGLVALLARRVDCPPLLAKIGPWLGFALIGAGLILIDGLTPFPGTAALLPVTGTALLCYCVSPKGSVADRLLTMPPAVGIGKISYSLYLWHWPFLVIGQRALLNRSFEVRLGLVLASVVAAIISYRYIESPVRQQRHLSASHGLNYGLAVSLIVISLAGAWLATARTNRAMEDSLLQTLSEASEDAGWVRDAGCDTNDVGLLLESCSVGNPDADTTVLLIGDSHSEHWEPALTNIVEDNGYRLVVRFLGGCPAPPVDATLRAFGQEDCTQLQQGTDGLLDALEPDLVVVSNTASYLAAGNIADGTVDQGAAWGDGVTDLLDSFDARGIATLWIYDNPRMDEFPIDCVALKGAEECNPDIETATKFQARARAMLGERLRMAGAARS